MDLYEILEIKSTASKVEIKKAYLKLIKIYHPDRNGSLDAANKLQKIQSAYEILINDKSRLEYQKMNYLYCFSSGDSYQIISFLQNIIFIFYIFFI